MTTHRADDLLAAIRTLPPQERLRLVEQVIHDVADAQAPVVPPQGMSIIGLFNDSADVIDRICEDAMRARKLEPMRVTDA